MRVTVIGAGVIGVTTAYQLARDGHRVTVLERHAMAAEGASHANGGQISAGLAVPWAKPNVPSLLRHGLGKPDAPLVFRPRLSPAQWKWGLRFLAACAPAKYRRGARVNLNLALYSRRLLGELRETLALDYADSQHGILTVFRDQRALEEGAAEAEFLKSLGASLRILNRQECLLHEPALGCVGNQGGTAAGIVGGLLSDADETGDAQAFTQSMVKACADLGVEFRFNEEVIGLEIEDYRIAAVRTLRGAAQTDAVVLAAGALSPELLRGTGTRLPMLPIKGYSVTLPIENDEAAPLGSITDEAKKVVVTRLGDRLRAAGTAELGAKNEQVDEARARAALTALIDLFPAAADRSRAQSWAGMRPMTPDCVPVVGETKVANLYLATGHGTYGWTMAAGTARIVADLVSGKTPDIDVRGLSADRF